MLSLYEILKASKTGIAPDMWTALAGMNWGGKDSGAEVKELTGIPPLSFTADGTPLLDYLISGNMVQTGTPTPQNPIQPSECGERTGNLLNPVPYKEGYYINENGIEVQATGLFNIWAMSNVYSGQTYTISRNTELSGSQVRVHAYYNGAWSEQITYRGIHNLPLTFTIPSNCNEVRISTTSSATGHLMLNTGETALSYEPFGIKIPISSNSITTPVYLGEVETTRQIKKLVLTGEENWNNTYGVTMVNALFNDAPFMPTISAISDRYVYNPIQSGLATGLADGEFALQRSGPVGGVYNYNLAIKDSRYTSVEDIKSYLAAQYANGTPVTVWYVLAEPETGIVNEPLRKIGNYADTLSMEQAQTSIPTLHGNTVIDVETTLKPSEMYIKYQG